ncbi:NADH-quinone oxidoreductase subunit L, partial [Verrucomicrobiales bacterium]|nr:NADH-quinone oxidoreductase subunit L [Verrucomicrobiales bacterium]
IAGVGLAIWIYKGREKERINIPLFANKFYIDEIYNGLIAIFQDAIAGLLDFIDRFVIDPVVARFPAMTAFTAGSFFRLFQVGNLQGYTFLFGAGVVALIWFLLF